MNMNVCFCVLLLCCVAAVAHADANVVVDSVNRYDASLRGTIIRVTGHGFSTYSHVSCVWGDQIYSFSSSIESDEEIVCETPRLELDDLPGNHFPLQYSFGLVFDGASDLSFHISDEFFFGPVIDSITPESGFTQGGNEVTIIGKHFKLAGEQIRILFNGKTRCELQRVVEDGTAIECFVPTGEFGSDATIDVIYANRFRVHSPAVYHYGPVVEEVFPPCGRITGGTVVTVTGKNFGDPLIQSTALPALTGDQFDVRVEVVFNNTRFVSPSVVFDGTQLLFVTPTILGADSFNQIAQVEAYFRPFDARAFTFSFRYGYTIDSFTGTALNEGGGNRFTITGCGLSQFVPAQVSVLVDTDGGNQELCFRGSGPGSGADSLGIIASADFTTDRIDCVTAEVPCTAGGSQNRDVSIRFTSGLPPPFQLEYNETDVTEVTVGPSITGINPTNGGWLGGQTVSILGTRFFKTVSSPGWRARVIFHDADTGTSYRRLGNILSNTLITTISPTGVPFGTDVEVSVEFFDPVSSKVLCAGLPRENRPTYTFGPSCFAVEPATGKLSGGNRVTLSGAGFLEARSTGGGSFASVTSVRVCLDRLNDAGAGECDVFQPVSKSFGEFVLKDDEIEFVVPGLREGVTRPVGGNRLFGDTAHIYVGFDEVPTASVAGDLAGPYVSCGAYQFTPVVEDISPDRASIGPPPGSSDSFFITGRDFDDPVFSGEVRVDIGVVAQDNVVLYDVVDPDTVIAGQTVSGGTAGTSDEVVVTFDTCNTTLPAGELLRFGPLIELLLDPIGNVPSFSEEFNPRQDSWGWHPSGGQQLRVIGSGFDEYLSGEVSEGFKLAYDGQCLIDGTPVESWLEEIDTLPPTYDLVCVTPARPFSTEAVVELDFGLVCDTGEVAKNRLAADQRIRYEARMDSCTPEFGVTSGGTPVTIVGEGFVGEWANYLCFFGSFTDAVSQVNEIGTVVQCATPRERGQFNTDVPISILLSEVGNEEESFRVLSGKTFHYGPVCFDVEPNNGRLRGGYGVSLVGYGFLDCIDSDHTPISNCQVENFFVHWTDTDTQVPIGSTQRLGVIDVIGDMGIEYIVNITMPESTLCQQHATATIEYVGVDVENDEQRFVECSTPADRSYFFHYGPLFRRQLSTYHRNKLSYGWDGTAVTMLGHNFRDPSVFTGNLGVECVFGDRGATQAAVIDDDQITCQAPSGTWNQVVSNITIRYTRGEITCAGNREIEAQGFHYGPVIDSITPDRGNVAGLEDVTISGFGFGCCGITNARCMFPDLDELTSVVDTVRDTITCPVPPNDLVDRQINNIGVRFFSNLFGPQQSNAYQTTTEDVDVLTYFYGPRIHDVQPTQLRLSGGQDVTVTGEGFTDPYFTGVFCDFLAQDPSHPSDLGTLNLIDTLSVSDDRIVCRVKEFNHPCGAVDHFRPRWSRNCPKGDCGHRTELGSSYYRTEGTTDPSNRRLLPYYTDAGGGAPIVAELHYGPAIVSAVPRVANGSIGNAKGLLQSRTTGGLEIVVTADDLGDWVTDEPDNGFGSELALCLFGDRRSEQLSPIVGNTVTCVTPPGEFGSDVEIAVLLDPHFTAATTIEAVEEPVVPAGTPSFHWTPYVSGISKTWGTVHGHEVLTVDGGGFCNYESVVCEFGDDKFENRFSVEGDIVNDNTIQCVTPPHEVGTFDFALEFCITSSDGDCLWAGEKDRVETPFTFTFAGVTGISPNELSACADLDVLVLGNGFSHFERFECTIGGVRTLAEVVNNTAVRCFGDQLLLANDYEPVSCHDVQLSAVDNLKVHKFKSPVHLEFGLPQLLRVDPAHADVDSSSEIVIQGRYFQGADEDGTYFCVFDDIETEADVSFRRIGNDDDDDALYEVIRCRTPTIRSHKSLTVGERTLEVRFDCDHGKAITNNRLPFNFVQSNTEIEGIFPDTGYEVGGTSITVFGNNFGGGSGYYCSFGEVDDDDDPRNNPNQLVSAQYIASGIEESNFEPVLVCTSPANVLNVTEEVDFRITVDSGKSFAKSEVPFRFTNVPLCDRDKAAASALMPTLALALSSFLLALLFV